MKLSEIKVKITKSIDHSIKKTNNFTELSYLNKAKKDLKHSNKNKTMYIIGFLKANTDCFDGYLDNIDYSNFLYYLR